ncbi:hypothetical protein ACWAU3_05795 [Shewanella sp. JL219SE-S6]
MEKLVEKVTDRLACDLAWARGISMSTDNRQSRITVGLGLLGIRCNYNSVPGAYRLFACFTAHWLLNISFVCNITLKEFLLNHKIAIQKTIKGQICL